MIWQPDTCVIVPTYNNAATLGDVLRGLLTHTPHILVVNDGSTDDTAHLLEAFPDVALVSYPRNRGKGWAIRQGFAKARDLGYRYAITIDSDGQHFARDLETFATASKSHPDALLIGARNMANAGQPGASSFGNRFSNFWFRIETGRRCPDTQSGYRLYPLERLQGLTWWTRRYEFEVEVLVRAAWKGIPVIAVPVSVCYPENRVTHFRPFKDFARISVLNAMLVLIMIFTFKWVRF
ncbi:glycosyltransferase family 2 protein [Dinghuibacter silviterrae]|uniref:Glycosyltransferase involved in cell wall biosynthesis n=1 Tax=Dinghuibacter silviterrae TaxID=1539049 RepID=A0A4R8DV30_9BACT|nr:glycosyltransferase family 2 protein [Dinghuibacter silviterrae]TDX02270.1 glycosyltransferase involved in cell wall biosynthesis [Dinghuibacter silviterrae]